jgi:hypothetical protein
MESSPPELTQMELTQIEDYDVQLSEFTEPLPLHSTLIEREDVEIPEYAMYFVTHTATLHTIM